jgi:hypothetical protein
MKRFLAITLSTLALSVPAFADTIPPGAKVFGSQPSGAGDPTAISCYRADKTGTHTTQMVCHRNSDWARLNRPFPNELGVQLQIQRQLTSR